MDMDSTAPRPVRVVQKAARIAGLRLRNRRSSASVLGDAPVTLSLTSYGDRLTVVGHTIESLAAGTARPQRMILWVDEPDFSLDEHPDLARLAARGLEVLPTQNWRPHKKYYSLLEAEGPSDRPIVVSDDDILYPRQWLAGLVREHLARPEHFLGYRAHWLGTDEAGFRPYRAWGPAPERAESPRVFITTGAGSVYPRVLQEALAAQGTAFVDCSPTADDVWVNTVAVAAGIPKHRTAVGHLGRFYTYPRTQGGGLHTVNVDGGNDAQILRSHDHLGIGPADYGRDDR